MRALLSTRMWCPPAILSGCCCCAHGGVTIAVHPQVLLGYPYDVAIDMWSLGCMAAELYLGLPLFPGASEHDLLVRIVEMLGMPPPHVLGRAQHLRKYFKREDELLSVGGVPMRHQKYRVSHAHCCHTTLRPIPGWGRS